MGKDRAGRGTYLSKSEGERFRLPDYRKRTLEAIERRRNAKARMPVSAYGLLPPEYWTTMHLKCDEDLAVGIVRQMLKKK